MMMIDWIHFAPTRSLIGGVVIGLAASVLMLFNGRIAGISGILGSLLQKTPGNVRWRIPFLLGLIAAPVLYGILSPLPEVRVDAGYTTLVMAGLCVGIGTRYGSGCTSGHGVCGLSRRSPRSLVATCAFMAAGFFTVFLVRHVAA